MPNSPSPNHLIEEKSPYLLQHAYNPVDWHPWGKEAFEKARLGDMPVLLSVGYSTCHWCHVMAHESFEDEGIARIINDHFVAIKVDREERPDIDHIYMTATIAMGSQGGWPLTVFLTPEGDPFYGGTYFPPYAKWGSIGFRDLLHSIAHAWKSDRPNILSAGRSMTEALRNRGQRPELPPTPSLSKRGREAHSPLFDKEGGRGGFEKAFSHMQGQFDHLKGGFGSAPKFPMGHNLSFLLRYYRQQNNAEALSMVEKTLAAMSEGGIYDHLGGGFHRYSTDRDWHVPHFEKMLYDQALLSRAYLEAYQVTGSPVYAQIARGTLDYVLKQMTDKAGGFYSAQDADSTEQGGHLKEGAFYVFSKAEIEEVLEKQAAELFNYCYGVLPQGNAAVDPHGEFKGKNIFYKAHGLQDAAARFSMPEDAIEAVLAQARGRLLDHRARRPAPHTDTKVLCDWNGLMVSSMALAARVLDEPRYRLAAARAADFILEQMTTPEGRLLHRWREGTAGIRANLEDYAFFIYGLLDLYEATFEDKYMEKAKGLAEDMIRLFADQEGGGFYMTACDAEELIMRPKEVYDGALPSGNSVAALILLRLHALTQKEDFLLQAQAVLDSFASAVAQAPSAHGFFLSALAWQLGGAVETIFHGRRDDAVIAKMLKVLYKYFVPFKAVRFVSAPGPARAQVCHRGVCRMPVEDAGAFEREISLV